MESTLVTIVLAAAALFVLAAAQTTVPPDPAIFAPLQTAGATGTGFPAFYVGCTDNGATLQDLTVYANDNFLRGIEVGASSSHACCPNPLPMKLLEAPSQRLLGPDCRANCVRREWDLCMNWITVVANGSAFAAGSMGAHRDMTI